MPNFSSSLLSAIIPVIYLTILLIISLYSFHKILMIWRYYRYRHATSQPLRNYTDDTLPTVTVQLPIFNEMYVVDRLLNAVIHLDYPANKLEIQVLDDSTDETQSLCQKKVDELRRTYSNIHYIHRQNRQGYKAGALANGLKSASGEFIAIFDADFMPTSNTLRQMVDYFSDPTVGMVQARWAHLNRDYSLLTELQALMLDGHFIIEQTTRHRSGCFFNFNGTAGIWRLQAIQDAGGWQHTTVTEDLDLSYRVQLNGWRCVYLPNLVVPAELPMEMNSFKSQQFRWAKGASQVAKNLLSVITQADLPPHVKWEAFLHLTNNFNYLLLFAILLLSYPYQLYLTEHHWRYSLLIYLPIFLVNTFNIFCFYFISRSAQEREPSPWKLAYQIFLMMSLGIGIAINQSLAVCEGLLRSGTEFVRTPKHGVMTRQDSWHTKQYRADKTQVISLEVLMTLYLIVTTLFAIASHHYLSLPFLIMFVMGYVYVLKLSFVQSR
jgi:cellulose synthase/poly-beta-1,6-N-acetylglucosamine synthase-like glycosyltransferase